MFPQLDLTLRRPIELVLSDVAALVAWALTVVDVVGLAAALVEDTTAFVELSMNALAGTTVEEVVEEVVYNENVSHFLKPEEKMNLP